MGLVLLGPNQIKREVGGGSGTRTHTRLPVTGFLNRSSANYAYPSIWWKEVFILKHLKLDGAPLPVTVRAYTGLQWRSDRDSNPDYFRK